MWNSLRQCTIKLAFRHAICNFYEYKMQAGLDFIQFVFFLHV